jgi:hypothetical protein
MEFFIVLKMFRLKGFGGTASARLLSSLSDVALDY